MSEREKEREILLAYLSNTYQGVFTEPQRERERDRERVCVCQREREKEIFY